MGATIREFNHVQGLYYLLDALCYGGAVETVEPTLVIDMLARRQVRIKAAGVREGTDPVLSFDPEAVDERNAGIRPHDRIANAERDRFPGPIAST